ncbi:DNA damage-regulated autophagy modulator protein 1 [Galendromus occidentalis]|uniref:DNA damage-regulated autophagy modulator protein 1 n=1 Tax=Galendromus occidentalis TaxID=34638 RepID=A0AAJ7L379_9ACAR|nr:DNA damage-regulated autophagy modulator protein 1 [Galendromus occidentalis]
MALNPRVRFIPLCVAILMPITFTISFMMARTAGHINGFNYISDTGTVPAESCYFGQLLNIIALLLACTTYHLYQLVDKENRLERISVWFGITAGIGASLVANFQELNVLLIHIVGALLAFGGGVIYLWLRTFASDFQRKIRWPICVLASVSLLACAIAGAISLAKYKHEFGWRILHWTIEDGGYAAHVVSVVAEWLTAISLIFYMISHYFEMCVLINADVLP